MPPEAAHQFYAHSNNFSRPLSAFRRRRLALCSLAPAPYPYRAAAPAPRPDKALRDEAARTNPTRLLRCLYRARFILPGRPTASCASVELSQSLNAAPASSASTRPSTSLVLFLPAPDETLPLRYCAVFPRCRPQNRGLLNSLLQPPSQPSLPCPGSWTHLCSKCGIFAAPRRLQSPIFCLSAITDRRRRLQRHSAHRLASTSASLAAAFDNSTRSDAVRDSLPLICLALSPASALS
ncbi:hypothetical protein CFAM422_006336 [Trichoderma lentiforme]|uniref:Uncharacterized protein n=1 Tax=Trichoderma lentiforme TaxID=1567552 RepID=A0A9P4XF66_9HYPO|nr:hypothetical protein CFAM422_006336 [Trichoderma lentiforme]